MAKILKVIQVQTLQAHKKIWRTTTTKEVGVTATQNQTAKAVNLHQKVAKVNLKKRLNNAQIITED